MTFKEGLTALINVHSLENQSDTPDFLLAQYLMDCLTAYEAIVRGNKAWHRSPSGRTSEL